MRGQLGKLPASPEAKDIRLLSLLEASAILPLAPVGFGHDHLIPANGWGMLGNDTYGDCVWAGAAHETMLLNMMNGRKVNFRPYDVLSDYAKVTGFDPATGYGDNGTNVHDALNYRRNRGVRDALGRRHKIGAFVSLEPRDWKQMLGALRAFDFVAIGFEFPHSADRQFAAGKPWTYVPGSQIEGGHYVPVVGRPGLARIDVLTWGQVQGMTRTFYEHYADEAYGVLSLEALNASGVTPEGLNLDALRAALAAL